MIRDLDYINKRIEFITSELDNLDSDERKEIKKNNKLIDIYVNELNSIKDVFFNEMNNKYESLIPNDNLILDIEKISYYREKVRYLSDNSYIFKMWIDKNLYEIRYSNSLDVINDNILDLLDKFLLINVKLTKDDFKYSISLYKYMSDFFDNRHLEDFSLVIKERFDSLYWECSSLVSHIYLCFLSLLEKYNDKFNSYVKQKYVDDVDYDRELDKYYKLLVDMDTINNSNEYLIYKKFSTNELRIDDYLINSINRKEIISKYIDYDKYLKFNNEEKKYFYDQLISAYYDLCEYDWIDRYGYIINKIKEIYTNKGSYINNYSVFVKNIKNLNKVRIGLNNKLFVVYNKLINGTSDRLLKKYNNLFNKVNIKIEEIIGNYDTYDEILFVNDIVKKIDDDSTYYDALKIIEGNYSYLVNFMKDNAGNYDDFIDYLYSPYLNISKNIPLVSDVNIEEKLNSKYDLFDMKINLNDRNKLKEDLSYMIRVCLYDVNKIDIDKFKLIFDVKKIVNE